MTQINVGMNFGREFEGELKAARAGLEVTSLETVTRERRPPHFEVISLIAAKS